MLVLNPQINLAQTIWVTPRFAPSNTIRLIDEQTKFVHTFNATTIINYNNYFRITLTPNTPTIKRIEEGKYYILQLGSGNNIGLREKVFCTSQNKRTYSPNSEMISTGDINNFITL